MKEIFTTGEAAEICKVSQQTIIRCFDAGRLKGFRVPGSRFRRIPRASLIAFMKEHGIPINAEDAARRKVLVVGTGPAEQLAGLLRADPRFEVQIATSCYQAGIATHEFVPDIIVVGPMNSPEEQTAICRAVRENPALQRIKVLVTGDVPSNMAEQLLSAGASVVLDPSVGPQQLLQQLTEA